MLRECQDRAGKTAVSHPYGNGLAGGTRSHCTQRCAEQDLRYDRRMVAEVDDRLLRSGLLAYAHKKGATKTHQEMRAIPVEQESQAGAHPTLLVKDEVNAQSHEERPDGGA